MFFHRFQVLFLISRSEVIQDAFFLFSRQGQHLQLGSQGRETDGERLGSEEGRGDVVGQVVRGEGSYILEDDDDFRF